MTDRAVSFDCFGTLVSVPRPPSPAEAVAAELDTRGIDVPKDWTAAYAEPHLDSPEGAELSLPDHASAALRSRGVEPNPAVVDDAVLAAFDRQVEPLPGAAEAVDAVGSPVGVLSNCSVPGLVSRMLGQVDLLDSFDVVVTSVDIGWRKPDRRAFEAVAGELDVGVESLVHVGDNTDADGGIRSHGGQYLHVDGDLADLPNRLPESEVSPQ